MNSLGEPSYSVDDILKEVRKRREENEKNIKKEYNNTEVKKENFEVKEVKINEEKTVKPVEIKSEKVAENKQKEIKYNKPEEVKADKKAENKSEESFNIKAQQKEEPKVEEKPLQTKEDKKENKKDSSDKKGKKEDKKKDDNKEEKSEEELKRNELLADKNGEVDLFDLSGDNENKNNNKKKNKKKDKKKDPNKVKFSKTKKGKIIISIIVILVVLLVGGGIFAALYIDNALNKVTDNGDAPTPVAVEEWDGMKELVESFDPIYEAPRSEVSSLSDMAKKWYYNGKPCSSTHVLNILLIGEDTRGDEIQEEGTRADSAIIASVNVDTGKITLTSVLRDTYAYFELEEGNKESGRFDKINAAMSLGDLDCYIRCIENNFKINIDNYVLVNFASFKTILETLGGVDINMTSAEIREINNNQSRYGGVTIKKNFEGKEGVVHLNGEQALAYSRIRYIDGDDQRANRQKTVLTELFKKAKSSSNVKLLELVTKLLPYVKTGASKQEIIDMGTYALKHGWINYEIQSFNVPENFTDADGITHKAAVGGTYKGRAPYSDWKWRADFPLSAQRIQNNIYGKTSIVLNENRPHFENLD